MEIVIIERQAFEAFMAEVSLLTEKVNRLCSRKNERHLRKWMDNEEVCRLLHLSPRTLQGMRDKGQLACSQIGKKFYYRVEDVEGLVSGKQEVAL
ncbi:MAG: helix-turn-helix domain-containing protein [Paraprevotella sp.]|nr:helix-turn-helix domain-containing protein [Paraprevotella sp.]